ncbi:MAG TPA: hypothetical protein VKB52_06850 [Rhodanobacteraceae bacterium]|nr:hypothetical protein [Rhodanobacteraceae bacterium]
MDLSPIYFIAWVLPALVGSGVWVALRGSVRTAGDACSAIGFGWLIGVFLAAECARLAAKTNTAYAFATTWPWLAAIGVAAWIVAIVRIRRSPMTASAKEPRPHIALRVVWWLLLLWIVVRLLTVGEEASLRPVFPWDAWSAWSTKPKTWFILGHYEPYVSMLDWLSHPKDALRTAASWSYPETLAWVQLWFASAAQYWNEPLVDVAWCGALAAFALAAYGCWRAIGLGAWIAIALVYGLVSLPLIDAHVALAGYADLWVAVTLGLATLAFSRWLILGERGQWALAIALALLLPAIKLEGLVWLLAFGAVVIVDAVRRRRRSRAVLVAGGVLAAVALVAAIGALTFSWNQIEVPSVGTFAFSWHGVGGAMLASLFTLPNWHLLWYLVPVLLVARRQRLRGDRAARLIGLMLLIDFGFLFGLFFLTTASAWAQDFTSANRLILQLVPSVFVLAAVLLRPVAASAADRDTAIPSVAPRVPA